MRILLIDDEPGVTENLVEYIEDGSHRTEVLNWMDREGDRLREMLEEFRPEGAVLDFDMVPSGVTVYGWIKDWSKAISVVFYTKYAGSPHHQVRMIDAGANPSEIVRKTEVGDDVPRLLNALRG